MFFFVCADNGGPVVRVSVVSLSCLIEISSFRKDLLLFFLISWIRVRGKMRLKRKCGVYKTTSSTRLNCNCQHSIKQKILLKFIERSSFETVKTFLTFQKMDPRILPNSETFLLFKKLAKNELTHYLLARLKHYKDHLVCILKPIFACKSFICVSLFVFLHVANGVEINTTVWQSQLEFIYFSICGFTSLIFPPYTCNN